MVNRTWLGGGNNKADNAKDWSPTGAPQPGDNLTMTQGAINVTGNDLQGNGLLVQGTADINLSQNATATIPVFGNADVSIRGDDSLSLTVSGSAEVDLAANSHWTGFFSVFAGSSLVVGEKPHASFITKGSSGVGGVGAHAVVNTDVAGNGALAVIDGGSIELGGSVGAAASVQLLHSAGPSGMVQIDEPSQFLGQAQLQDGQIDLEGLAKADSYTYQNDMLSIFSGRSVIDTLNLADSTPNGFAVEKTAGGVNIVSITDPMNPPMGLPLHVG